MNIVIGLLNKFGLPNNCLILTGYSLEAGSYYEVNPNDTFDNPTTHFFDRGLSCAQQLKRLEMISPGGFDFFLIDGNHEGSYLQREIESADKLLKLGGLLILDDVNLFWSDIQKIYESIDENKYQKLGADGRVGILKKIFYGTGSHNKLAAVATAYAWEPVTHLLVRIPWNSDRVRQGCFTLRSPNVLLLMGSPEEIEAALLKPREAPLEYE